MSFAHQPTQPAHGHPRTKVFWYEVQGFTEAWQRVLVPHAQEGKQVAVLVPTPAIAHCLKAQVAA
jgi:hypothetical protein